MKEKIYKLFLILMVSLSLGSGSIYLFCGINQISEIYTYFEEEKQKESEEIRKKKSFLNYFQDIL